MLTHHAPHLTWTLTLAAATAALLPVIRNRAVRRRLLFGIGILLAAVAVHAAGYEDPGIAFLAKHGGQAEGLLTSFGCIAIFVALAFNPWFHERTMESTPAIVQDTVVVVLVVISSMFVFENATFLAGLTASGIVIGLALQDTLGNAFAGLAIQVEKPFRVGHWITAANYEGRVVEVTWRATKIRTKLGNLVVLPNSMIAKEAINNFSEPEVPTMLVVDVGAAYGAPPNLVRTALLSAVRQSSLALRVPEADVLLYLFGDSAITYRVRFWIDEFDKDEQARDQVRRAIYYEFARQGIEIPWPIRVHYSRQEEREAVPDRLDRYARLIARVPVLAALDAEGQRTLIEAARERVYGDGETIVREGDTSDSMFIICRGEVAILVGSNHEVARTAEGGYFGEMSLLTGEPRSATVVARGDCTVLEISAAPLKAYVTTHPSVIEHLAQIAAGRRRKLDETRAAAAAGQNDAHVSLADRMRRFLGL